MARREGIIWEGDDAIPSITYDELRALARSQSPAVREIARATLREIDTLNLTVDEIERTDFTRPTIFREVVETLEDGTRTLKELEFYIGISEADRRRVDAEEELEELGVAPSGGGGGGGGGFYDEDITSDQWQRIRQGEIDEDEARWENDPDNYDEDGELRPYGTYADEDELDDEGF
tara:strand:+ start:68 stop:598 length:531 start_codon:yes stop_codon:yes gene_type:complete